MGFSKGMNTTPKKASNSDWIKDGNHIFQVNALKEIDGYKGKGFVAELVLEDTDSPDMKLGGIYGWIRMKANNPQSAMADVREFLATLAGCDQDDITEETFPEMVAEAGSSDHDQPMAGHYIGCYAFTKKNKTNDGSFTHTRWSHIGDELEDGVPNSVKEA